MSENLKNLVKVSIIFILFLHSGCTKDNPTEADTQAPTVSILYPVNGSEIKADTTYAVIVDANDNKGVSSVDFYIDGIKVGTDNSSPYQYLWNTTGKVGDHSIMAKASDAAGNTASSKIIAVKVLNSNNPPNAPSSPSPSNGASGISTSPTLTWNCSDPDAGDVLTYDVYFGTDNPPATKASPNQLGLSFSRSNLTQSTLYYWKIVAKDNHSNPTSGPVWSFTTGSGVISQDMVSVASGTFTAGSTPVTISSFKIDKYEVTYELWTDVYNWGLTYGYTDLPTGRNGYNPAGSNNPVTEVNWYDIVKWCNARSEKDGLTPVYYTDNTQSTIYRTGQLDISVDAVKWTANGYRLPTECEWEFAARGGNSTHGYNYSGSNTVGDVAWYSGNSGNTTHTVGIKTTNELGIYDMSGNVWEWCWDWYGSAYPAGGTTDPKGPTTTQTYRLFRGGSFYGDEDYCRVGYRDYYYYDPGLRYDLSGFRCVQD